MANRISVVGLILVLGMDAYSSAYAQSNPARAVQARERQRQRQEQIDQAAKIELPPPIVPIAPKTEAIEPVLKAPELTLPALPDLSTLQKTDRAATTTAINPSQPAVNKAETPTAPKIVKPRFSVSDDFVLDAKLALRWTQADSAQNLSWVAASNFCQQRQLRLPTSQELLTLFDRDASAHVACGSARCKAPTQFELRSRYGWYWSSKRVGDEAEYIALDFGVTNSESIALTPEIRALCVGTI
jgi:hypothetical protein